LTSKGKSKELLPVSELEYKLGDGVTYSILSRWVNCRVRALMTLHRWRAVKMSESASFGSMAHEVLHHIYETYRPQKKPLALGTILKRAQASGGEVLRDYIKEKSKLSSDPALTEELEYFAALLSAMLPEYIKKWEELDGDFSSRRWVGLEDEFDLNVQAFAKDGFRLRGKRDGLFEQTTKSGEELWLLETKTSGQINEVTLMQVLSYDAQVLFYLVLTELQMERKLTGAVYNMIRKPMLRQKKATKKQAAETYPAFIERVQEDIAERPDHYFHRFALRFYRKDLEKATQEITDKLLEFAGWLRGEVPTYKNEYACRGRISCPYIAACASRNMNDYIQTGTVFPELSSK
jgi:hypothetical protein